MSCAMTTSSARAIAPSFSPLSRHAGSGSRYAPRPATLPRRSTESSPAGDRTIRTRSRFARTLRQATQVRCGVGREAPASAALLLFLSSEERAVLLIQVLLIRHRRLGFDLRNEVVADR